MKKIMMALFLWLIVFSFCACAGSATPTAEKNDDKAKIDLGNAVLVDDDTVTIKAVSFFSKEWKDYTDSCVCFEVTNNTEREILVNIHAGSLYLGDIQAETSGLNGNSGPLPGKTGQYSFIISREEGGDRVPIESLEELYDLNGIIEISVYSKDGSSIEKNLEKEYSIDLSTLK